MSDKLREAVEELAIRDFNEESYSISLEDVDGWKQGILFMKSKLKGCLASHPPEASKEWPKEGAMRAEALAHIYDAIAGVASGRPDEEREFARIEIGRAHV